MRKRLLLLGFLFFSTYVYSIDFKTDSKNISGICFTAKGAALGIADYNSVKIFSVIDKKMINEFTNGHKKQILAIDISKDSTLLVSGGRDSTIVVWDFINARILKTLKYHSGIITSISISPDKRYLISGGSDKKLFLYDIEKDEVIHEFADHSDDITSVKFSPNGSYFASASGDGCINFYNTGNFKLISSSHEHNDWVRNIAFSNDSYKLFSCGDDSQVIIWTVSAHEAIDPEEVVRVGRNWLLSIDVNEDNKTYATGSINGNLKIFSPYKTYSKRLRVPVNKVLFLPNLGVSLKVAVATRGKGVILLDALDM